MAEPHELGRRLPGPSVDAAGTFSSLPDLFKWVRVGLAGLAFLGFWIFAALISVAAVPTTLLLTRGRSRFERAAACQRWIQRGFPFLHVYMRWFGVLHFM